MNPSDPSAPALLVVGHGTRDDEGAQAFRSFVQDLAVRHLPRVPVAGGFIELSPPPLTEAVAGLVERGVRRFAAVPLMLVAAGHAKGDIPAALTREKLRQPGVSFAYGRPLGPHPSLLDVLERRVDEALGGDGGRAGTTVLLVGRGSTDPDANAEVFKAARLLWEGRGYAGVETAFVSLAAPDVAAGLERCRALGARRVVVLPYFLFTGVLPERVREQARAWAADRPETDVRCADVIGPTEELAGLVVARYREAIEGDIRMNCDACVYRVALPGFADKVGMPQQPHHHPDDDGHHGHGHGHGHHHEHGHAHAH
ncbi:sirohydrochlorin chelatase [Streptomyces sp. NBC_01803]|uniref:sirohydrochlorin chelatase n=1 Tax=Streptomyces sp. NBC_01803 TaxID=2975946 RepID=UPI002DD9D2E6|nr:sirohydrochlorin chelatase [Streptomyces sp. NBC_01803]WSA46819.1 sirohydrochlorin chelatase [Streptomyces sp. NBC_01803]